jgi:hypothetical protein
MRRNREMSDGILERLIVALDANTAAHIGKPAEKSPSAPTEGARAAATSAATPKAAGQKAERKITAEQIKAAVMQVKDTMGRPAALNIIKTHAKAVELASIKPQYYAAVMAACDEAMTPAGGGDEDGEADADEL